MRMVLLVAAAVAAVSVWRSAVAEPIVKTLGIADAEAVLIRPEQPKASVVLMPGGTGNVAIGYDGAIQNMHDNLLVRTRFTSPMTISPCSSSTPRSISRWRST